MSNQLTYPIITKAAARTWFESQRLGTAHTAEVGKSSVQISSSFVEMLQNNKPSILEELSAVLLVDQAGKQVTDAATYEFQIGMILYERLIFLPIFVLADPDFWRWFSIADELAVSLVNTRHSSVNTAQANPVNYGLGNIREGFFSRSWLRVFLSVDAARKDKYELSRKGDQDFWRSHILRQSYAKSRPFVKALIDFQYKEAEPTLKPSGNKSIVSIRELAKRLSVSLSTIALDVMSYDESRAFIETTYSEIILDAERVDKR